MKVLSECRDQAFKIELATATHDIEKIASVVNAAYKKAKFLQEEENRVSQDEVKGFILDPSKRLYLCISPSDEICGTILLKFINEDKAEIGLFAIHPDYQGKKIAAMFMNHVETEAFREVREIILEVIPLYQENLVKFYERLGYKATGQLLPFPEEAKSRYIRPEDRDRIVVSIMRKNRS